MFRFPAYLRARRHEHRYVDPVFAMPVVSFSVAAPLCFENPLILKMKQRVDAVRTLDVDITSLSAVSAARTSSGNKLLSAKSNAAVPSVSCNYLYFCSI